MTPAQLATIGRALYGPEWQTPLADALGVADRTVRRWVAGDSAIPDGVAAALTAARETWRIVEQQIDPIEVALTDGSDDAGRDATAIVAHAVARRGHRVRIVRGVDGNDPAARALAAAHGARR